MLVPKIELGSTNPGHTYRLAVDSEFTLMQLILIYILAEFESSGACAVGSVTVIYRIAKGAIACDL